MKRIEILTINNILAKLKQCPLQKDAFFKFIRMKATLSKEQQELESVQKQFQEDTKPEELKDESVKHSEEKTKELTNEWNKNLNDMFMRYLNEDLDIDSKILTEDEVFQIIESNTKTDLKEDNRLSVAECEALVATLMKK